MQIDATAQNQYLNDPRAMFCKDDAKVHERYRKANAVEKLTSHRSRQKKKVSVCV